jgi:hypothetical protein
VSVVKQRPCWLKVVGSHTLACGRLLGSSGAAQ